jgi:hypothetical protein
MATSGFEIVVELVKVLIEEKGALFVEAVKVLVLYRHENAIEAYGSKRKANWESKRRREEVI